MYDFIYVYQHIPTYPIILICRKDQVTLPNLHHCVDIVTHVDRGSRSKDLWWEVYFLDLFQGISSPTKFTVVHYYLYSFTSLFFSTSVLFSCSLGWIFSGYSVSTLLKKNYCHNLTFGLLFFYGYLSRTTFTYMLIYLLSLCSLLRKNVVLTSIIYMFFAPFIF